MPNYIDVADSIQSLDSLQGLLLITSVDDQLGIRTEKSTHPVCKSAVKANAKTTSNHSLIQLFSVPDVNHDRVISLCVLINLIWCELDMRFLRGFLEEEGLEFVDLGIVAKILRRFWHVLKD